MQRKKFIQNILSLGALNLLPQDSFKHYKKFYLLQCFVAGFRFYNGMKLLDNMNEGDMLQLLREPQNEYDECAVALLWNNEKIGFIPSDENQILSRLIDANALELMVEITHLNKDVKPWENLCVAVYFLKEANKVPPSGEYLSVLNTPFYTTYKNKDGSISKVNFEEEEVFENEEDWYTFLVDNSKDNGIYDIIHTSNVMPNYNYATHTEEYLLVNKNTLPPSFELKDIIQKAERLMGELTNLFAEDGYIVMTTQEAEKLIPRITAIVNVTDKLGRHYIELLF
jgi:hypothetical protein